MTISEKIRNRIKATPRQELVHGKWRSIRLCLDQDAGEFLNVGIAFQYGQKVEVQMLDTFSRLSCLYDHRFDQNDLAHYLHDIEAAIINAGADFPTDLGPEIEFGDSLVASGASPEQVVEEFFNDIVTLAKPRTGKRDSFRYHSTPKLRDGVLRIITEKMQMSASQIIKSEPYRLPMRNTGKTIDVDVPLLSANAVGQIVSVWYKSPVVVENNLLQAASDILLVTSNTERKGALSVLLPSEGSGMSIIEFNKVNDMANRQMDRLSKSGVDIIAAASTDVLANKTIDWWTSRVA